MRNEIEGGFLERITLYAGIEIVVRVAARVRDGTRRHPGVTIGLYDRRCSIHGFNTVRAG
jgi:hypothetical protein